MMPVIRISDDTFEKLQRLAKPLVDTPDSVIARCLDAFLAGAPLEPQRRVTTSVQDEVKKVDPDSPPNLAHTKVRSAKLGSHVVETPNWNKLLRLAHVVAFDQLGSLDALRKVSGSNLRSGRHETEGFSYLAGSGFSLQGEDSNKAWSNTLRLAKNLGLPLEVRFEWYDKPGAARPGEQAQFVWRP